MSRYDGLIIPRSYNEYFNRSDPRAIQQVVKMATDEELNANSENPIQNQAVAKLVPATASETNQLADKNFVNSSIGTNTANYIYKTNAGGENIPFDSVDELEAYSGTVTQNDYAFVTGIDENGNRYFDRYKANVNGGVVTWAKEYRLNNSSFTAEQWAAIESGITTEKVATYDAGIVAAVDYVEADEMAPVTSNAVYKLLIDTIYPKGAIFWTEDKDFDPNVSIGGTWARIKDKFIYAYGDGSEALGSQAGNSSVTLSTANLPKHTHYMQNHTHSFSGTTGNMSEHSSGTFKAPSATASQVTGVFSQSSTVAGSYGGSSTPFYIVNANLQHNHSFSGTTGGSGTSGTNANTGDGGFANNSFSIMPPYERAYCWKRTA